MTSTSITVLVSGRKTVLTLPLSTTIQAALRAIATSANIAFEGAIFQRAGVLLNTKSKLSLAESGWKNQEEIIVVGEPVKTNFDAFGDAFKNIGVRGKTGAPAAPVAVASKTSGTPAASGIDWSAVSKIGVGKGYPSAAAAATGVTAQRNRSSNIQDFFKSMGEVELNKQLESVDKDKDNLISEQAKKLLEKYNSERENTIKSYEITDPDIVPVIKEENLDTLINFIKTRAKKELRAAHAKNVEFKRKLQDPMSEEAQELLMNQARQNNIEDLLSKAVKHRPDNLAFTHMLYVTIIINNKEVQAFVDTGAQQSIITMDLVEELGMTHLIDERFKGVAQGVGFQKIEGRIHLLPFSVKDHEFEIPVTVMPSTMGGNKFKFLMGLDTLKKFKFSIDCGNDVLIIGDSKIPFLTFEEQVAKGMVSKDEAEFRKKQGEEAKKRHESQNATEDLTDAQKAAIKAEESKLMEMQQIKILSKECDITMEEATSVFADCEKDLELAMATVMSMK